jgi:glutamine amidotransferase
MSRVAVVDYGMCNLDSVARAIQECGGQPVVTSDPADLKTASHIVLPGVGAFPDAMRNIRSRNLEEPMREQVETRHIPFLGICLGMQLLATTGTEVEESHGLGWIEGEVRRLVPTATDCRVPHVGWNELCLERESPLFSGLDMRRDFYFVHSFHLVAKSDDDVLARTPYADGFVSAVQRDHVFGVQFHPEKSQRAGFQVFRNFLRM